MDIPMTESADRIDPAKQGIRYLYAAHGPGAISLAYLLTGDEEAAHDLVHDAFVRLLGRFQHIRDEGAFGAYLRRTVVNLAKNRFRSLSRERAALNREQRFRRLPPASIDVEERDLIWSALRRLSYRQRAVLVLRYYEDLREREIAALLRCSVGTVKSLTSRASESLRGHLAKEEES